jgi:hypothetical protein
LKSSNNQSKPARLVLNLSLACATALSLTHCANEVPRNEASPSEARIQTPPVFQGKTVASPLLKANTLEIVGALAMAKTGCRAIDTVNTEIVEVSGAGVADAQGRAIPSVRERWTLGLCGQRIPCRVNFSPDGQGGTNIQAALE